MTESAQERDIDPLVREYMKDVDVTLLRENLKLTVEERFLKFERFMEFARELREAGERARAQGEGGMDFPPEHYFQTAIQRMRQSYVLFREGASFALAIYVGGLAVECMLRAFKGRHDAEFDERHDLLKLFGRSGIFRVQEDRLRDRGWTGAQVASHMRALRVALNEVAKYWNNNYRFASEERLRSHLKRRTGYQRIRGDYLREMARRFLDSAQKFIDKGTFLWDA